MQNAATTPSISPYENYARLVSYGFTSSLSLFLLQKVHILTHDAEHILRVMSKSPNVVVDTQRQAIKPSWKLQRNTIIIRDVPSDATEEEVCVIDIVVSIHI